MAIHLLRDYLTQSLSPNVNTDPIAYVLAIFLRRVLGYTTVGQTNFDIENVGTFLLAQGNSSPNRAGINFGAGSIYEVSIPTGVRTVSSADIGRMLVLKSTANPRFNSGVFLITGFNGGSTTIASGSNGLSLPQATINVASTTGFLSTGGTILVTTTAGVQTVTYTGTTGTTFTGCTGGTGTMATGGLVQNPNNRYIVNWRSGDSPPAEAADTVQWWLYSSDGVRPSNRTPNAGTGYRSYSTAGCSRIILQSPHASGWQVRICLESSTDYSTNGVTNLMSYAPGFGGNSSGDFAPGGDHLHSALWWDTADPNRATQPGQGNVNGTGETYRLTMVGDEEGTGLYCFIRRPGGPTNWHLQFGMCESEPTPLPSKDVERLYTMGHNSFTNSSQTSAGLVANSFHYRGIGFSDRRQPCCANIGSWSHIETNSQFGGGPWYNANAGDNPFTGSSDLLPVDIVTGFGENWFNQQNNRVFQYQPRLIGQAPFVRQGRANFTNFTTTSDAGKAWQHLQWGIFIPWGGPAVLP